MGKTSIEWAEHSWNPITGCTKVSLGCKNCYAERMAKRQVGLGLARHERGVGGDDTWVAYSNAIDPETGRWSGEITCRHKELDVPMRRKKPTTYFVCSMSDLFHEGVPWSFIDRVFHTIEVSRAHTFIILTKRSRNMLAYMKARSADFPLLNAWLGVSVEDQATADARLEDFRATPAAVKFVSYEPALGPVDWTGWEFIDLLIFGGESGPGARPAHPDWFRNARDWAGEHGIARFFKQYGEWIAHDIWHQAGKPRYTKWGCMNIEGTYFDQTTTWNGMQYRPEDDREVSMYRIGKKAAGCCLDGQKWNEMPILQTEEDV